MEHGTKGKGVTVEKSNLGHNVPKLYEAEESSEMDILLSIPEFGVNPPNFG
jgi:hypothetical protein